MYLLTYPSVDLHTVRRSGKNATQIIADTHRSHARIGALRQKMVIKVVTALLLGLDAVHTFQTGCLPRSWPSRSRLVMVDDVPLDVHGFSVSPNGFVALLTDGKSRMLPLPINDVDKEEVVSAEALVLLQLLQGIDMGGPCLPPERLNDLLLLGRGLTANEVSTGAMCTLSHMLASGQSSDSLRFELTAQVGDGDGARVSVAACPTAFEAVALCMRYKASFAATTELLDEIGLDGLDAAVRYPKAFTWRDAQQQDNRVRKDFAQKLSEATGAPVAPSTPTNANRPDTRSLYEKALKIAIDKGDTAAEAKIRAAIAGLPP